MIWYKHEYFLTFHVLGIFFMDDCIHDIFFRVKFIPFFSLLTCNMHNGISLKIPRKWGIQMSNWASVK